VDRKRTCRARPDDTNASRHHQLYRRFHADDDPLARRDAASGTDQEERACTPDVQRFCRKLMDQGDFTILACVKENRPKLTLACRTGQPRAIAANR